MTSIPQPDLGNLYPVLQNYQKTNIYPYSFLSGRWADADAWRAAARAKLLEVLCYAPKAVPLASKTLSVQKRDGYTSEKIRFDTSEGVQTEGYFLLPDGQGPFPAVIALHDHGGFYYYGKEKLVDTGQNDPVLKPFSEQYYGGRFWASELAKHGFAVLCIDAFYFGTRRAEFDTMSAALLDALRPLSLEGLAPGSEEYIAMYNAMGGALEPIMTRHMRYVGMSWAGLLLHDDRKCVDYLQSRPEVDSNRIGCCGLSVGGFRSVLLAGAEERIKCFVSVGMMSTFEQMLSNHGLIHTHMLTVTGLGDCMDYPDMAALASPSPLLLLLCRRDQLFTLEGMQNAAQKIESIYTAQGGKDAFRYEFFDEEHAFTADMQQRAFAFLAEHLGGGYRQ